MSRFHIIMPFELKTRMKKAIPLGLRSDFSRTAIEMAVEAIEEHGPAFLGLMLAGEVVFRPNPKKEAGQILTAQVDEKRTASS